MLTIKASEDEPYAWDGCTPKINVLDFFVVGTPDGRQLPNGERITQRASLVHDALYQYLHVLTIRRRDIDRLFLKMLADNRFKLRHLYYIAVRLVGGLHLELQLRGIMKIKYESTNTD